MHGNIIKMPPQVPVAKIAAAAAQALIDLLDAIGGDPDLEDNGDELDGDRAEDEAGAGLYARLEGGPGCPIADPDHGSEERGEPEEGC